MKGTFVIATFDHVDRATTVFNALNAMRRRALFRLDDALIVTNDRFGHVRLQHSHSLANTKKPDTLEAIARLMFVWGQEKEIDSERLAVIKTDLQTLGLERRFMDGVSSSLRSDTSAICFIVKPTSPGDAFEIIAVLTQFQGNTAHTTITEECEAYLTRLRL